MIQDSTAHGKSEEYLNDPNPSIYLSHSKTLRRQDSTIRTL